MLLNETQFDPSAALWRDLVGPSAEWGQRNQGHLLASIANGVRVLAWQNTADAGKKPPRNYPELILPPGAGNEDDDGPKVTENTPAGVKHFGTAQMTVEETNEWLGW